MSDTVRLRGGKGPEVTVPPWANKRGPLPEEWLEWFLAQSREAQITISAYHLICEASLSAIEGVIETVRDASL